MIKLLIISIVTLYLSMSAMAQKPASDSLTKLANADVKKFKLSKADFKQFRKDKSRIYSDWFKPNYSNVSDTALLADSGYVKAFRSAAYSKTLKRRTTGHYFLVGGVIYGAATLAAVVVTLFVLFAKATK